MNHYETAMSALKKVEKDLSMDEHDALHGLVSLFVPYRGDDAEEAKERTGVPVTCTNCGWTARSMFFPASLDRSARAALRLSQCPRCFCTSVTVGEGSKSDLDQKIELQEQIVEAAKLMLASGGERYRGIREWDVTDAKSKLQQLKKERGDYD